jgi:hypothetical protein
MTRVKSKLFFSTQINEQQLFSIIEQVDLTQAKYEQCLQKQPKGTK